MLKLDINDLRKCIGRELGMRKAFYAKQVKRGRMAQQEADHEIACMERIYAMLKLFEDGRIYGPGSYNIPPPSEVS